MFSVKTGCARCLPRVIRRMLCAGLRPNVQVLSGPEFGPCIASRPMARRIACSSQHATTWLPESSRQSTAYPVSLLALAFRSFRSRCSMARSPLTIWTTRAKPLAVLAAFLAAPAHSEGFVLSMRADGQLETKSPQSGFAQSYVDGIGANPPELIDFEAPEPVAPPPAPARAVPRPEILAALESTAHRYGGHPALRRAGLSVTEWQALFQANIEIESAIDQLRVARQARSASVS